MSQRVPAGPPAAARFDRPPRLGFFSKRGNKGYLFIAPFFLAFLTFQLYPIISTFVLSLQTPINMYENEFIGLGNYQRLFTTELFYQSIGNTWKIWLMNFIPQVGFALYLGVVLTDYNIKGKETFRTFFFLPNLVTAASIGVLFAVLMDWRFGTLNMMLMRIGIISEPINYLTIPGVTQATVSFIQWWQWFGYTTIIVMAGLSAMDTELYEAAYIDGAGRGQVFYRITLPLLRPTLAYIMVTSLIGGLQIFDIPRVLTNGRGAPDNALTTMVLYLYNQAFRNYNVGYAAALAYVLFIMILILSVLSYRMLHYDGKPKRGGSR
ncbi:carbohydrate ABC transporter permease [Spirochaeta lutea]|uniref:carbohydrate ABC transporter permease n=1 Tax=Spirochaeta lutea TaxID=1480694 RepID=UPI0009DD0CFF|nr:sugar ABC transporter permease [Spirochaeta lutea]